MKHPKWTVQLLETGAAPYSMLPQHVLSQLSTLNLVRIQCNKTRRNIEVVHREQFAEWVRANFPDTQTPEQNLLRRAENIFARRSSKSGQTTHDVQPVLFKCFAPDETNKYARLTEEYGMAGIMSDRLNCLHLPDSWYLLTVENWESFYPLTYPNPSQTIIIIYLDGNVANITLSALAGLKKSPECILHYGDYDWTGLTIFQRIQSVLPKAELYIPDDTEDLFRRYARRDLTERQKHNTGFNPEHPKCLPVTRLIEQYNGGLEQEIVTPPCEKDFLRLQPVM
ncbi:MAG: Wadjet anti-phage system protein JetD domain-containing protein [Desulfococcaceae bacterium]